MTQEGFKRKLTAILSADVEGYSRLMGEDEDATIRTLTSYRELMTTLIQKHRGRVVDSPGDNLLAEFGSVVDAVRCAVEIQEELRVRNAELLENKRMNFRIGINLGDVVQEEERIYGDGINIAARVEGLAEGGGICISGTVYDSIKNKLSLSYESLGEHTVKNITEPVRVYRMRVGPEAAVEPRAKPWHKKAALAALVVLIVAAGAWAIWHFSFRPPPIEPASEERMAYQLPDKPSIAVLAFENMSGDPKQEYFSDGITEQIISSLSKVPRLFVIARNSTFTYKGRPVKVQKVAEDLGVQYVMEGSIQKSGDRVRITAQLIDAITGHHIWSERYDRDLKDIFALQDEITIEIIKAMRVEIEGDQYRYWIKRGTKNLKAYEKTLQGLDRARGSTKQDFAYARQLYEEAIALDPNWLWPQVHLGWTHFWDGRAGWSESPRKSFKEAFELAQKILAVDDSFDLAHSLLGAIYVVSRQYEKGLAEAERAVALNPNGAFGYSILGGTVSCLGRWEDSIVLYKKAIRLDPSPRLSYLIGLGRAYFMTAQYDEAISTLKKALNIDPDSLSSHAFLAACYSSMGRDAEATAAAKKVLDINPKFSLESYAKTLPYKNKADVRRHIAALRKAGLPETPSLPLPDKPSIAVLPFMNMSGDPKQEYFSDGITEEIITALSKIPKLFVIARNSTFTYKNKPTKVQQVGRELGVKYVLEGSVRKSGDRVRITAQLVDAQTGHHLWAERYDRDLKDVFAIQDEITENIITALQIKLTEGEQARLIGKGTDDLQAYLKFLQARELCEGALSKEKCVLARRLAEEAIALDHKYSEAYAVLAQTYSIEVWLAMSKNPQVSLKRGLEKAQKAVALDNSNAHAYAILAALYIMQRQHDKALAAIKRAYELEPNSPDIALRYGMNLYRLGRFEEALPYYEEALRLNPIPPNLYLRYYGIILRELERYDEAIAVLKKAIQQEPNSMFSHLMLTVAYSLSGREQEAHEEAKEVLRINPRFSVRHLQKTLPFKNPAHTKRLTTAMRKAGLPD